MKNNYILIFAFTLVSVFSQAQSDLTYEFTNNKDGWGNIAQSSLTKGATYVTMTIKSILNTAGTNNAALCKYPVIRSADNLGLVTDDYAVVRIRMKNNTTKAQWKLGINAAGNGAATTNAVFYAINTGVSETGFADRDFDLSTFSGATINRLYIKGNDYAAHCDQTIDIDFISVLTNASFSTTEFSQDQFLIKNNPVNDKIQIVTFNNLPVTQLNLYDLSGKLIKTISNSPSLNVSELNPGLYLLNIHSELGQMTRKIIKR